MPAFLSRFAGAFRAKAYSVPSSGGWFGTIRESFAGAFQAHVEVDAPKNILAFSAVFACVTKIAADIGKLRVKLVSEDELGICTEIKASSPFQQVLRKPNNFQNRIQFIGQWVISKLLHGNTYVLKQRDMRGIVVKMFILDAERVTPLVADNGDVYYQLAADHLSGLTGSITVPASEIIHDRMNCLFHPLVGISPIYACGMSATMGNKIQANSATFFQNMSRPGGMLTAPAAISDEVANRLKNEFEANFSGDKLGRLFVGGDGLAYTGMGVPADQAQLIEQLRWTVEDVARCFGMPLFKIGGPVPANNTIEALNQQYYSDCLQVLIEAAELCLDEGLALPADYYTEFDLDGLLRMDTAAQVTALKTAVDGALMAPNEGRRKLNLKPLAGGDTIYMQQQNYSLQALQKRDAQADPFGKVTPSTKPGPEQEDEKDAADAMRQATDLIEYVSKGLECTT